MKGRRRIRSYASVKNGLVAAGWLGRPSLQQEASLLQGNKLRSCTFAANAADSRRNAEFGPQSCDGKWRPPMWKSWVADGLCWAMATPPRLLPLTQLTVYLAMRYPRVISGSPFVSLPRGSRNPYPTVPDPRIPLLRATQVRLDPNNIYRKTNAINRLEMPSMKIRRLSPVARSCSRRPESAARSGPSFVSLLCARDFSEAQHMHRSGVTVVSIDFTCTTAPPYI